MRKSCFKLQAVKEHIFIRKVVCVFGKMPYSLVHFEEQFFPSLIVFDDVFKSPLILCGDLISIVIK